MCALKCQTSTTCKAFSHQDDTCEFGDLPDLPEDEMDPDGKPVYVCKSSMAYRLKTNHLSHSNCNATSGN